MVVRPVHRTAVTLRRIQYMLAGLLLLFAFWSISLAKVVVLPIVLGFLITLTLSPLVRWLARFGIPAGVASVLIIFSIGSGTAYGLYMLRYPAQMLIQQAPDIQQELRLKLWTVTQKVEAMRKASEQVQKLASGNNDAGPSDTKVVVQNNSFLQTALASLAGIGSSLVIAMLLAMFLLASGDMFHSKLVEAFPEFSNKRRALRISRDIERQISRYLAAITVINAGLGIAIGTTLHLLGMPYGLLWGVAAFLLNYLPYLGGMLGTAVSAAVALVTFDSFGHALLVPFAYMGLTSIEGQMITPYLVGKHLRLNTVGVFIAVIFWAWLWGVAGALMAVPFLVFVKVLCDHIPGLNVIGTFLDGDTREVPRERRHRWLFGLGHSSDDPSNGSLGGGLGSGGAAAVDLASRGMNAAAAVPPILPGGRPDGLTRPNGDQTVTRSQDAPLPGEQPHPQPAK